MLTDKLKTDDYGSIVIDQNNEVRIEELSSNIQ